MNLEEFLSRPYMNKISKALHNRKSSALILLGGPPCQAYSIVGRARKVGHTSLEKKPNLLEEFYKDQRHTLYKEYLKVLSVFSPEILLWKMLRVFFQHEQIRAKAGSVIEKIFADLRAPAKSVMEDQNFIDEIEGLNIKIKPTEYILFLYHRTEGLIYLAIAILIFQKKISP